jgi:hypothetical protein
LNFVRGTMDECFEVYWFCHGGSPKPCCAGSGMPPKLSSAAGSASKLYPRGQKIESKIGDRMAEL